GPCAMALRKRRREKTRRSALTASRYRTATRPLSFSSQQQQHRTDRNIPSAFLVLHRNGVVTGRQQNSKASLFIGRERCDWAFFVFYYESRVHERLRTGDVVASWPGANRTDHNYPFDATSRFGLCLSPRKATRNNDDNRNGAEYLRQYLLKNWSHLFRIGSKFCAEGSLENARRIIDKVVGCG